METIKKKGQDINIVGLVIHQVTKEQHTIGCGIKLAKNLIIPTDKEKLFVYNVKESYYKKSNPTYGIFGNGDIKFKKLLTKYLKKEIDFLNFSTQATTHYKTRISQISPATGGHIIYVHFNNENETKEFLLVLTTNNKDGFFIDEENLTIKGNKSLDLNKIDVACLINLTQWKDIEQGKNVESKTYLSFIKGNKGVSLYFLSFIDCNDNTTSTESTKRLVKTLDKYCDIEYSDRDTRIQKKNQVFDYCLDCINNKKEIQLGAISALIDNENPNKFMEYAAQEENGVSTIISGDKTQLRKMKYTFYKSVDLTIIFDNTQLDKTVFYDRKKKQLTFKKLPDSLIEELEK